MIKVVPMQRMRYFLMGLACLIPGCGQTDECGDAATCAEPRPGEKPQLQPASLRLQASPDGHRIQKSDGTPFFWMGDTAWSVVQRLSREDFDVYLSDRAKRGFTVTWTAASLYSRPPKKQFNAPNFYGEKPFGKFGDLHTPNDAYFETLDYFINAAAKKGIYVALVVPGVTPDWISNAEEARWFGNWIGTRYRSNPNIIWVLGGDVHPDVPDANHVAYWEDMAEGIAMGVNDGSHPDYSKCFMTYHGVKPSSSGWYHNSKWYDVNGVYTYVDEIKIPSATMSDYALTPPKPSVQLEPEYEYPPNEGPDYYNKYPFTSPDFNHRQAYWTYLSGGVGYNFGAGPIFRSNVSGDKGIWQDALGWDGSVHMTRLKTILTSREWSTYVPDQSLVASDTAAKSRLHIAAARSSAGDSAMVYVPVQDRYQGPISPRTVDIALSKLTAGDSVTAKWVNPINGSEQSLGTFAKTATHAFTTPAGWRDAVLVLDASGGGSGSPPPGGAIGNRNVGSETDTINDYVVFFKYETSGDVTVKDMQIHLAQGSSAQSDKLTMSVYDDNDGYPGGLLRSTVEGAALGDQGWHKLALTSPLPLEAGHTYWLAVSSNTKNYVVTGEMSNDGANKYIQRSYGSGFPTPMTQGGITWGVKYNMFAE